MTSNIEIHHGDCIETMRNLPDNSVDSIVTDPPYGLSATTPAAVAETMTRWATGERDYIPDAKGFMGKSWDAFVPPPAVWDEAMRVLKPGGHLLAFAGSRTQDLMGLSIRLAGFEIRDSIAWHFGSGFPKSHDVGKSTGDPKWAGFGTALKPATEPIILARKPFKQTVAANVQEWGTGALNINASRVGLGAEKPPTGSGNDLGYHAGGAGTGGNMPPAAGRWPANVVLDEHAAQVLDGQSGVTKARRTKASDNRGAGSSHIFASDSLGRHDPSNSYEDTGGASRFFYVAKAPKKERPVVDGVAHATVKPLALMRWLVKLVTPPGGTVLEPFAGSGTTVEACILEGFNCIAIEREAEYLPLIQSRIDRQEKDAA